MAKWLLIVLVFCITLQAQAFEDYIITTNGKLTDISIEDNTIVDVYPLITVMNEKNTLMVSPLKEGKTRFCVLKNNKHKVLFDIEVFKNRTKISNPEGFTLLAIDDPADEFPFLDEPPILKGGK